MPAGLAQPCDGNPVSGLVQAGARPCGLDDADALEDTVAAKPTAAYDAKWGRFVIDPALFTKLVYEGV